MIPTFPEFKNIELEDRPFIDAFTKEHGHYSDFNFTNLWSWDIHGGRKVSLLNGNLVVLFTDYNSGEPVLSFLGNNKIRQTTHELLAYAEAHALSPILRFIPEESIQELDGEHLHIVESAHDFDYIFSTEELAELAGPRFNVKRHLANKFIRENPEARFAIHELTESETQSRIISVLKRWEDKKVADGKEYSLAGEELALRKLLDTAKHHDLILTGISLNDTMIGFSIDEVLPQNYAISHFVKADNSYRGVYEFLNQQVSRYLYTERDVQLWNWEQDLQIEGLRTVKMSYRPIKFLRKYSISLKDPKSTGPGKGTGDN